MTVATGTFWASGTGNGSNRSFTFSFPITSTDELVVLINGSVAGNWSFVPTDPTDYSIGGEVLFDASFPPANGANVLIIRRLEYLQETDLTTGYNNTAVEREFDRATMRLQQLAVTAPQFPDTAAADGFDVSLPDPADGEAGAPLVLNADKSALEYGSTFYTGPQGPPGEVAYSVLSATASSSGASLIGLYDSGAYFTSTSVEAALQEAGLAIAAITSPVLLKGGWDASGGTFPGGSSVKAGWSYVCTAGGTVDSVAFVTNDRLLALVNSASSSTYAANWLKLDYSDLVSSVAGKTGTVTLASSDLTNLTISTASPSGGSNGDIWFVRAT